MKLRIGLMILFCLVSCGFSEMRIWTSIKGDEVEAEYVKDGMGKVWLKFASGKVKKIPVSALSRADQDYILLQTLPKIEINIDDDITRGSVGSDIDNVREKVKCAVNVKKTSRNPYPMDYELIFVMIAFDLRREEYILQEKITEIFSLNDKNSNSFTVSGKPHILEYDPDPPWGKQFIDVLAIVKTSEGEVVCSKGRDKYMKHLNVFAGAKTGQRFYDDFSKVESN